MPHRPVPHTITVKVECLNKLYEVRFKAGKKEVEEQDDPGEPGVVTLVFSSTVLRQLMATGYIPEYPIQFPNIESLRNDKNLLDVILGITEVDPDEGGASGDCLCFEDHRGEWRCICEN